MDISATDPGLPVDPPAAACPRCGGGCGAPDAMTMRDCAILAELSDIGMMIARTVGETIKAAGKANSADLLMFEMASRSVRRTLAMRQKLLADSRKTPEQRAAEDIRRAEAAERARFRDRQKRAEIGVTAIIKRKAAPSDREYLLGDMHERLLDPRIELALTQRDVHAVILSIAKDLGIVPKNETWSDALLAYEISATHRELKAFEAERAARPPGADSGWEAAAREGLKVDTPDSG